MCQGQNQNKKIFTNLHMLTLAAVSTVIHVALVLPLLSRDAQPYQLAPASAFATASLLKLNNSIKGKGNETSEPDSVLSEQQKQFRVLDKALLQRQLNKDMKLLWEEAQKHNNLEALLNEKTPVDQQTANQRGLQFFIQEFKQRCQQQQYKWQQDQQRRQSQRDSQESPHLHDPFLINPKATTPAAQQAYKQRIKAVSPPTYDWDPECLDDKSVEYQLCWHLNEIFLKEGRKQIKVEQELEQEKEQQRAESQQKQVDEELQQTQVPWIQAGEQVEPNNESQNALQEAQQIYQQSREAQWAANRRQQRGGQKFSTGPTGCLVCCSQFKTTTNEGKIVRKCECGEQQMGQSQTYSSQINDNNTQEQQQSQLQLYNRVYKQLLSYASGVNLVQFEHIRDQASDPDNILLGSPSPYASATNLSELASSHSSFTSFKMYNDKWPTNLENNDKHSKPNRVKAIVKKIFEDKWGIIKCSLKFDLEFDRVQWAQGQQQNKQQYQQKQQFDHHQPLSSQSSQFFQNRLWGHQSSRRSSTSSEESFNSDSGFGPPLFNRDSDSLELLTEEQQFEHLCGQKYTFRGAGDWSENVQRELSQNQDQFIGYLQEEILKIYIEEKRQQSRRWLASGDDSYYEFLQQDIAIPKSVNEWLKPTERILEVGVKLLKFKLTEVENDYQTQTSSKQSSSQLNTQEYFLKLKSIERHNLMQWIDLQLISNEFKYDVQNSGPGWWLHGDFWDSFWPNFYDKFKSCNLHRLQSVTVEKLQKLQDIFAFSDGKIGNKSNANQSNSETETTNHPRYSPKHFLSQQKQQKLWQRIASFRFISNTRDKAAHQSEPGSETIINKHHLQLNMSPHYSQYWRYSLGSPIQYYLMVGHGLPFDWSNQQGREELAWVLERQLVWPLLMGERGANWINSRSQTETNTDTSSLVPEAVTVGETQTPEEQFTRSLNSSCEGSLDSCGSSSRVLATSVGEMNTMNSPGLVLKVLNGANSTGILLINWCGNNVISPKNKFGITNEQTDYFYLDFKKAGDFQNQEMYQNLLTRLWVEEVGLDFILGYSGSQEVSWTDDSPGSTPDVRNLQDQQNKNEQPLVGGRKQENEQSNSKSKSNTTTIDFFGLQSYISTRLWLKFKQPQYQQTRAGQELHNEFTNTFTPDGYNQYFSYQELMHPDVYGYAINYLREYIYLALSKATDEQVSWLAGDLVKLQKLKEDPKHSATSCQSLNVGAIESDSVQQSDQHQDMFQRSTEDSDTPSLAQSLECQDLQRDEQQQLIISYLENMYSETLQRTLKILNLYGGQGDGGASHSLNDSYSVSPISQTSQSSSSRTWSRHQRNDSKWNINLLSRHSLMGGDQNDILYQSTVNLQQAEAQLDDHSRSEQTISAPRTAENCALSKSYNNFISELVHELSKLEKVPQQSTPTTLQAFNDQQSYQQQTSSLPRLKYTKQHMKELVFSTKKHLSKVVSFWMLQAQFRESVWIIQESVPLGVVAEQTILKTMANCGSQFLLKDATKTKECPQYYKLVDNLSQGLNYFQMWQDLTKDEDSLLSEFQKQWDDQNGDEVEEQKRSQQTCSPKKSSSQFTDDQFWDLRYPIEYKVHLVAGRAVWMRMARDQRLTRKVCNYGDQQWWDAEDGGDGEAGIDIEIDCGASQASHTKSNNSNSDDQEYQKSLEQMDELCKYLPLYIWRTREKKVQPQESLMAQGWATSSENNQNKTTSQKQQNWQEDYEDDFKLTWNSPIENGIDGDAFTVAIRLQSANLFKYNIWPRLCQAAEQFWKTLNLHLSGRIDFLLYPKFTTRLQDLWFDLDQTSSQYTEIPKEVFSQQGMFDIPSALFLGGLGKLPWEIAYNEAQPLYGPGSFLNFICWHDVGDGGDGSSSGKKNATSSNQGDSYSGDEFQHKQAQEKVQGEKINQVMASLRLKQEGQRQTELLYINPKSTFFTKVKKKTLLGENVLVGAVGDEENTGEGEQDNAAKQAKSKHQQEEHHKHNHNSEFLGKLMCSAVDLIINGECEEEEGDSN